MGMIDTDIAGGNGIMDALLAGLQCEFGKSAGHALAQRFVEAEEADFLWDARIAERWIGGWESDDGEEVERIAVLGKLGKTWFTAILLVDGEGRAQGVIARRNAAGETEARALWAAS